MSAKLSSIKSEHWSVGLRAGWKKKTASQGIDPPSPARAATYLVCDPPGRDVPRERTPAIAQLPVPGPGRTALPTCTGRRWATGRWRVARGRSPRRPRPSGPGWFWSAPGWCTGRNCLCARRRPAKTVFVRWRRVNNNSDWHDGYVYSTALNHGENTVFHRERSIRAEAKNLALFANTGWIYDIIRWFSRPSDISEIT